MLDPNFSPFFAGATFASPERVVIDNPPAGEWTALVQGFTIQNVKHHDNDHDKDKGKAKGSKWEMRITDQNGKSIVEEKEDEDDDKHHDSD